MDFVQMDLMCFVSVMGRNGTLLWKLKYAFGTLECAYFSFEKCPI
jgi:hypothetical protein